MENLKDALRSIGSFCLIVSIIIFIFPIFGMFFRIVIEHREVTAIATATFGFSALCIYGLIIYFQKRKGVNSP